MEGVKAHLAPLSRGLPRCTGYISLLLRQCYVNSLPCYRRVSVTVARVSSKQRTSDAPKSAAEIYLRHSLSRFRDLKVGPLAEPVRRANTDIGNCFTMVL